jgi:hypothetical protein
LPIHGGLFMAYASSASSSPVRPGFFYACFGELAEAAVWAEAANSFLANSGEASLLDIPASLAESRPVAWPMCRPMRFWRHEA